MSYSVDEGEYLNFEREEKKERFFDRVKRYSNIVEKSLGIGLMGLGIGAAVIVGAGLSLVEFGLKATGMTLIMSPMRFVEGLYNLAKLACNAIKLGASVLYTPVAFLGDAVLKPLPSKDTHNEDNDEDLFAKSATVQNTRMNETTESMKSSWKNMINNARSILGNVLSIVTLGVISPDFEIGSLYTENNAVKLTKYVIGEKSGKDYEGTHLIGMIEREVKDIKELASTSKSSVVTYAETSEHRSNPNNSAF
jgi:hypothetical protein